MGSLVIASLYIFTTSNTAPIIIYIISFLSSSFHTCTRSTLQSHLWLGAILLSIQQKMIDDRFSSIFNHLRGSWIFLLEQSRTFFIGSKFTWIHTISAVTFIFAIAKFFLLFLPSFLSSSSSSSSYCSAPRSVVLTLWLRFMAYVSWSASWI